MIPKLSQTTHGRKLFFDRILSEELSSCNYSISAFFESKPAACILSVRSAGERRLELGINLSFRQEPLFADCERGDELSLLYRAYFIAGYIRCLEQSRSASPESYFQGLCLLKAICALQKRGRTDCFSPLSQRKLTCFRPIDAQCAKRALTRLLLSHRELLSKKAQAGCTAAIDEWIHYSRLPEIEYDRSGRAEFTLLKTLAAIRRIGEPTLAQFALFEKGSTLEARISDPQDENPFWAEVALRLSALLEAGELLQGAQSRERIAHYLQEAAACFGEQGSGRLMQDNLIAIKKIARGLERAFDTEGAPSGGALHSMH